VKWNPCKQIIIEIIKMFIYLAQQGVVRSDQSFLMAIYKDKPIDISRSSS